MIQDFGVLRDFPAPTYGDTMFLFFFAWVRTFLSPASVVVWPPPLVLLKMWVVCAYECMTELRMFCQGPINIGARTQAEDVKMTQVFTYFQRKSSDLLIRVKGAKRPPRGGLQLWFKVSVVYVLTPLWKEGKKSRDNRVRACWEIMDVL